jgi:ankyrin repeat protein
MEKGADLSIKKEGSDLTALNMAMKKGHTDVINILFGQDSGMGAQAADLEKYLILAAESGDAKVAQTLLEKGADLNARAEEGEFKGLTALHIAATKGHLDLVKALTEHAAQTDPLGPDRKTPFLMAFEKGNKEVMELLATSGANINAKGELDNPALITATRNQDPEMVRFLLEKGADPNAEGAFFKTALDYAVKLGNLELARLLIDSGANINRKARSDGKTPLMVAAENGNEQMVELLLERGADKAIQDNIGYTAKKYALMNGHLNVVKLLSGNSQAASADSDTKQPSAPMSDMSLSR